LSEVLWSPKEKKNWSNFEKRLQTQFKRYDLWKANYSKAYFDVKLSLSPTSNYQGVKLTAETKDKSGVIRYKTTGKENVAYTKPLLLNKSSGLVFSYNKNKQVVNHVAFPVSFNKVTGKKISIKNNPSENYPGQGGAFSLVNGIYSNKGLSYSDWLGWVGDDMEAVIDLGKKDNFSSVKMHTLEQSGSWVYLPEYIEVLTSNDGKNFSSAGKSSEFVKDTLTMGWITLSFPKQSARYIKVVAKNYGVIPDGKPGAGNKAWLFADEIQVN
jgi:hexosaminidase